MAPALSRLLLMLLFVSSVPAAETGGRYTTPEQSPVFGKPRFISLPVNRAYPGVEYNIRPAVIGGTWPYTFSLSTAPEGMLIDGKKGTISWKAPLDESTVNVAIAVKDSAGRKASQSFTIAVGKKGFVFVSPNGDDANPGTFEKPWKTVMRAAQPVEDAPNTTLYLRGGEYKVTIPPATGKNGKKKAPNVLNIRRTSPRRWVAWPGEKPVIDLGWTEAMWKGEINRQLAKTPEKKKRYISTQRSGHRIHLDHKIDGMLFDGLEVKNASYYMFVMHDGYRKQLTWRRCHLHHLYGDYAENPSFIFGFAASRKYAKPAKGERFAFGKRPQTRPYRHIVVQDCVISDRPYWNGIGRGVHGGGLCWYTTQECLVEDCRFERIQRGQCIIDKDNGWDNTYRNNLFLGNVMIAAQGCCDGINMHHNFIRGKVNIAVQPGWVRNIWFHHNAVRGPVSLSGVGKHGPLGELGIGDQKINGPLDPNGQTLVRKYPVEKRLVFAWANAIDIPDSGRMKNMLIRLNDKGDGFVWRLGYINWGGNLMDKDAVLALGWSRKTMSWADFTKTFGFEKDGATGKVTLDDNGHLPKDSPWRKMFGREAGL